MAEMPNLGALAYAASLIYIRRFVYEIIHHLCLVFKEVRSPGRTIAFIVVKVETNQSFILHSFSFILKERFEDIVPIGKDKQRKEQPETNVVRHLKELIARLLPRNNLP